MGKKLIKNKYKKKKELVTLGFTLILIISLKDFKVIIKRRLKGRKTNKLYLVKRLIKIIIFFKSTKIFVEVSKLNSNN